MIYSIECETVIPFVENATIPDEKITKYLLNVAHVSGAGKAQFFLRFGFTLSHWQQFRDALMIHVQSHDVASTLATPEGIHYVVEGVIRTPDGRDPAIRSVWALDTGSTSPRLITAYPLKKGSST